MSRGNYKSRLEGLDDDTFNVGTSSDPAKFNKLQKNIETNNQKNYKSPDHIVKALEQMDGPTLDYPGMPSKKDYKDKDGNEDPVAFEMAVFAWKEEYKVMRVRKDRYRDNELNAQALIYNQCSPELKNKLEGVEGYEKAKETNKIIQPLKMIRNYLLSVQYPEQ